MDDRRIERREYKYFLPKWLLPEIRHNVQLFCHLDKHAGDDGFYTIRSLYFDTHRYDLYLANEREQADRFKVRARSYPATNDRVILEVKHRVLDVIDKSRVCIPMENWTDFVLNPSAERLNRLSGVDRQGAERFLSLLHLYHLKPVMLVEYEREAYASSVDDYARVTFDCSICSQPMDQLELVNVDPNRWRYIDHAERTITAEPVTILELKFENIAPVWMNNLVQKYNLIRYAFSKYCYSIEEHYILPIGDRIGAKNHWL